MKSRSKISRKDETKMTIKDFYNVYKDNAIIEFSYDGNDNLFSPAFYSYNEIVNTISTNIEIKRFTPIFSCDNRTFLGFSFIVDKNDYDKIIKAFRTVR